MSRKQQIHLVEETIKNRKKRIKRSKSFITGKFNKI